MGFMEIFENQVDYHVEFGFFSHYEAAFFEIIVLFIVSVELEYFFLGFET